MTIAILAAALVVGGAARAQTPTRAFFQMKRPEIVRALKQVHKSNPILSSRIAAVSGYFLGTPYLLGPLGEGPSGDFDRLPLYRFDAVDCTTFVEEVMALSLDSDLDHALSVTLQRIRYKNGAIGYESRNHFPELDWLPNNIAAGYLQDITRGVAGPLAKEATKTISKRDWYLAKTTADLQGFDNAGVAERQQALAQWKGLAAHYQDAIATIPYVAVADIPSIMSRIPSGAVANLVRADRPDKPILISHQVLLIQESGTLYVRQASYGRFVEDIPLLDYLKRYEKSSWPLMGLNLDAIRKP